MVCFSGPHDAFLGSQQGRSESVVLMLDVRKRAASAALASLEASRTAILWYESGLTDSNREMSALFAVDRARRVCVFGEVVLAGHTFVFFPNDTSTNGAALHVQVSQSSLFSIW
jgi:hypothetical protein